MAKEKIKKSWLALIITIGLLALLAITYAEFSDQAKITNNDFTTGEW
jgi:predicted ribosomally synthesized peptide with SipW-like signal peptide